MDVDIGYLWCILFARICKLYNSHAIPRNYAQFRAIPLNSAQFRSIPRISAQIRVISRNGFQIEAQVFLWQNPILSENIISQSYTVCPNKHWNQWQIKDRLCKWVLNFSLNTYVYWDILIVFCQEVCLLFGIFCLYKNMS